MKSLLDLDKAFRNYSGNSTCLIIAIKVFNHLTNFIKLTIYVINL